MEVKLLFVSSQTAPVDEQFVPYPDRKLITPSGGATSEKQGPLNTPLEVYKMPLSNLSLKNPSNSHRMHLHEDTNRTADSKERPRHLTVHHQIEPLTSPNTNPSVSNSKQYVNSAGNIRMASHPATLSDDHLAKMNEYLQKNAYYFHPQDKSADVSTFTPSDNYNKFGNKQLKPTFLQSNEAFDEQVSQQPISSLGKVQGGFFASQLE